MQLAQSHVLTAGILYAGSISSHIERIRNGKVASLDKRGRYREDSTVGHKRPHVPVNDTPELPKPGGSRYKSKQPESACPNGPRRQTKWPSSHCPYCPLDGPSVGNFKYTDDPLTEVHVNASNSLGEYVRLSDSGKYVYINLLSYFC